MTLVLIACCIAGWVIGRPIARAIAPLIYNLL